MIFHKVEYSVSGGLLYIFWGLQVILSKDIVYLKIDLTLQTVHTLMKCCVTCISSGSSLLAKVPFKVVSGLQKVMLEIFNIPSAK